MIHRRLLTLHIMADEDTIQLDLGPPQARRPPGAPVPPVSNMRDQVRRYRNQTLGATSSGQTSGFRDEPADGDFPGVVTTPTREDGDPNEPTGRGNLRGTASLPERFAMGSPRPSVVNYLLKGRRTGISRLPKCPRR